MESARKTPKNQASAPSTGAAILSSVRALAYGVLLSRPATALFAHVDALGLLTLFVVLEVLL